jgi:hypothetical protein
VIDRNSERNEPFLAHFHQFFIGFATICYDSHTIRAGVRLEARFLVASVAQLAERRIRNAEVAGSTPAAGFFGNSFQSTRLRA